MKPGDLAAAKAAADQLFYADEKARELLGSLAPGFYTNSTQALHKLYTNYPRMIAMRRHFTMTLRVEKRSDDYALFLDRRVIRVYKTPPSRDEIEAQELAVMQALNAYDDLTREWMRPDVMIEVAE